jgi:hypothetical protein
MATPWPRNGESELYTNDQEGSEAGTFGLENPSSSRLNTPRRVAPPKTAKKPNDGLSRGGVALETTRYRWSKVGLSQSQRFIVSPRQVESFGGEVHQPGRDSTRFTRIPASLDTPRYATSRLPESIRLLPAG